MNIQELDLVKKLSDMQYSTQRELAENTGYSLGKINSSLRRLEELGYLDRDKQLTQKAKDEIQEKKPQNAIILAAGFGMRMIPVNLEVPKGLLEIHKERLIERIIKQLNEAGIQEIYIVVGFMKEQYEYLIDKYGVQLVFNEDYKTKNNLFSLNKVADKIGNTYIIPCDIWCMENPFSEKELYSWYMVTDAESAESTVRVNRKKELVCIRGDETGNQMIGISYILKSDAEYLREKMRVLIQQRRSKEMFWEEALLDETKMFIRPREVSKEKVWEINTLEELRDLDHNSLHLEAGILKIIQEELDCGMDDIKEITLLKKGMTNRSFLFSCKGKRYIMRIPGEGTDQMINRKNEYKTYQELEGKGICDPVIYIDSDTGYKMTGYLEHARVCDPQNEKDVKRAMDYLRKFHERKLQVGHTFDLFGQMEWYESLWNGAKSVYMDYDETKKNVYLLKEYVDRQPKTWALTHIDAVPDNFLYVGEDTYLIDWEYAGMQDIHVDIAMFAVYALYDKEWVDRLIGFYFEDGCSREVKVKIYCYIAICGLLWSNWCEYKRMLGVEFGEYSLRQYRYAKEYFRYAQREIKEMEGREQ